MPSRTTSSLTCHVITSVFSLITFTRRKRGLPNRCAFVFSYEVALLTEDDEIARGELKLDYRLRLWAPTSASRAISAVAELLVIIRPPDIHVGGLILPGILSFFIFRPLISELAERN